jgi:hypothetical protein
MHRLRDFLLLILSVTVISCNKDGVIESENIGKPVITFDNKTGIYTVKTGHQLVITPQVTNAEGAVYTWTIDSRTVSHEAKLTISFDEEQEVYATLRVETSAGIAEEDIEIDVLEYAAPVISLIESADGIKLLPSTSYTIEPDFRFADDDTFSCRWLLDGKEVSKERTYTFSQSTTGSYNVTIEATNEDGTTRRDIVVEVVDQLPYKMFFETPSYFQTTTDRSAVIGRPIYLRPLMENLNNPSFQWYVNGELVEGADSKMLKFTPTTEGIYKITVRAIGDSGKQSATADVTVHCYTTAGKQRTATATSSKYQNKVYEFLPAPGQFVNEITSAGYKGNETTHAAAIEYATTRLEERRYVSLGGFGGYIIVGFDHSITNHGGGSYDFAIQSNAYDKSNEPGIVWVMQDTNGNGLPDDEWYELRGSETGKSSTVQDYEVTYYRPANKSAVRWKDSEGAAGQIDYLGSFHNQLSYYPNWIDAESYTLRGTRLATNSSVEQLTGYWINNPYEWGYADNFGNDNITGSDTTTGDGQRTGFKISNAMHRDGTSVDLKFIDFVKVQVGMNAKSTILGEVSTEVFGFEIIGE